MKAQFNFFNTSLMLTLLAVVCLSLVVTSCKKDDDANNLPTYKIVNNGNGAVTEVTDLEDSSSLGVAQPIPSVQGEEYSINMPIILFLNDKILLSSLKDNFTVTMAGETVGGTITIGEGANGFAILTFVPDNPYAPNTEISLTLTTDVQDDGGNGFATDYTLTFDVTASNVGSFDGNSSFEDGYSGVYFEGDGDILQGTQGCVSPTSGNKFGAITTGIQIVSTETALGNATSLCMMGPISDDISSVTFKYNFMSSEFQEFVGSLFDDSFIITVAGPDGSFSDLVTSVNTIGENNTQCDGFPNMPDTGDNYAGSTGWMTKTVNFPNVGQPSFIIFTVTDVSDFIYSSVVAFDEVNYN